MPFFAPQPFLVQPLTYGLNEGHRPVSPDGLGWRSSWFRAGNAIETRSRCSRLGPFEPSSPDQITKNGIDPLRGIAGNLVYNLPNLWCRPAHVVSGGATERICGLFGLPHKFRLGAR